MKILDKIRHFLGVRSPSLEIIKESKNVGDWIREGLEEGMKDPIMWFDQNGNLHMRELTTEERRAFLYARQIVARAFPGFYDDIEEG